MGLQNERELEELLGLFAHGFHVLFTAKTPKLKIIEKDPDDDKFIECAVALNSKIIISGDKYLRWSPFLMTEEILDKEETDDIRGNDDNHQNAKDITGASPGSGGRTSTRIYRRPSGRNAVE